MEGGGGEEELQVSAAEVGGGGGAGGEGGEGAGVVGVDGERGG